MLNLFGNYRQIINNYNNYFRSRFLPARIAKDLTIEQLSRLEEEKNNLTGIITNS